MQKKNWKQQSDLRRERGRKKKLVREFLCGRDSAAGANPGGVQGSEASRREHISDI